MLRHFVFTTKTTQLRFQIFSFTRLIIWPHRHEFSLLKIPQNLVDGYDEIFLVSVLANQKRNTIHPLPTPFQPQGGCYWAERYEKKTFISVFLFEITKRVGLRMF